MTIDEAIEKEKLEAVSYCDTATAYHTDENIYAREEERYRQKAEYHAQIAEWLRELKIHREIHDILLQTFVDFDLDICCDDLMDNEEEQKICEENCDNKTKSCWVRWAKMKAKEVNVDGDID